MIRETAQENNDMLVLFKVITRQSWRRVQTFVEAHPGSRLEHVSAGIYVVHVPAGGALEASA